jgi:DHA1 family multidrug resistance protein-like MFS transporter
MCVLIGVNQLGFGAIVPTISLYAKSFGVSATAIGFAIAIYGLSRLIGAPLSGGISDKFGRRHSLALGGIVTALGNLICAVATSYPEFLLGRFVSGAGAGLVLTTGQIVLADISTPERRGRMISIYQGTFLFSVGIGPFPGGILADAMGLAAPFWAYAGLGLVCTTVAWIAVGETREFGQTHTSKSSGPKIRYFNQLGMLAKKRGFTLVCLVSLMFAVIRTGGFFALIPLIGSVSIGLSQTEIGLGMFLGAVAGLLASFPGGMIADRFGRKAVIVPASIMTSATMAVFAFAAGYPIFMAACILWGIATSVGGSAPAAYAADSAPPGMNATTMSTFRMVGDVGYVIGPILLGLIADVTGPSSALLAGAGMMAVTVLIFALLAPETWRGTKS